LGSFQRDLSFYDTTVEAYANKPLQQVTIRQMIEFGRSITPEKLIHSAQYVHEELPKRLARRLTDLRTLPYIMVTNPYVRKVYDLYIQAFDRLKTFPKIETQKDEEQFTLLLKEVVGETTQVVDLLAKGTFEATKKVPRNKLNIDEFLENMLLSRIGRRVLAEQHIMLHRPSTDGWVGVINTKCSILTCVQNAFQKAAEVCYQTYGIVPTIEYKGNTKVTIPYIPAHLEFVCFELLKNAMRAVVEHKNPKLHSQTPDIEILIAEGPQQTTIRFSDLGGGIPSDTINESFNFGYTTASLNGHQNDNGMLGSSHHNHQSPMAGLGFGLPMARIYAKHFGGDLELISMHGYGADLYLRLDRTGDRAEQVAL